MLTGARLGWMPQEVAGLPVATPATAPSFRSVGQNGQPPAYVYVVRYAIQIPPESPHPVVAQSQQVVET
jgi:hypothetical protein